MSKNKLLHKEALPAAKPRQRMPIWSADRLTLLRKAAKRRYPSACDCACK